LTLLPFCVIIKYRTETDGEFEIARGLIRKDSLKKQIVDLFVKKIESGRIPPFTKLQSVRGLCKQFDVSQNVILGALDELEKRGLIHRVPRSGIFVSENASNPQALEVLILSCGHIPDRNTFTKNMFGIISSDTAVEKINFTIRIFTMNNPRLLSKNGKSPVVKTEVAKLSQTCHADCALVLTTSLSREEIEDILRLPMPVVFLGNFNDGDYEDLEYCRFGFVPNYFDAPYRFALEHGYKKLLLIEGVYGEPAFEKTAKKRLRKQCAESGIQLTVFELENYRIYDSETVEQLMDSDIQKILELDFHNGAVYFNCLSNERVALFAKKLQGKGFFPKPDRLDFLFMEMEFFFLPPDIRNISYYTKVKPNAYKEVHADICEKLFEIAEKKRIGCKYDYELKTEVRRIFE